MRRSAKRNVDALFEKNEGFHMLLAINLAHLVENGVDRRIMNALAGNNEGASQ